MLRKVEVDASTMTYARSILVPPGSRTQADGAGDHGFSQTTAVAVAAAALAWDFAEPQPRRRRPALQERVVLLCAPAALDAVAAADAMALRTRHGV